MPILPCPPLPPGVPLDGGALPVSSTADVQGEWSEDMLAATSSPIRDAIIAGHLAMLQEWQRRSRYAAAQSDILRATDEYLAELLEERGVQKQPGETDYQYLTRALGGPGSLVSPAAVLVTALSFLTPYTSILPVYEERSDAWFTFNETSGPAWCPTLQYGDAVTAATTPVYPDRLYLQTPGGSTANVIPQRMPQGARPNSDSYGRWFLLRVPEIGALSLDFETVVGIDSNNLSTAVFTAPTDSYGLFSLYTSQGTSFGAGNPAINRAGGFAFLRQESLTSQQVYQAMIDDINSIIDMSVRWTLVVDPNLTY